MKKVLSSILCAALIVGSFSGCGKKVESDQSVSATQGTKPVNIKIFMGQPEYTDAYNALASEYNKQFPNVKVDFEVIQSDYPTLLKTRIGSGNIPDVFWTTTGSELKQYEDYSTDFTNEPFIRSIDPNVVEGLKLDGKVLGLPLLQNYEGIIYNKKSFADAGITELPKTTSELEEVCKKLQAKGITPFASAYKEWWVQKVAFGFFLDAENKDVGSLIGNFKEGKTKFKDHPLLMKYFDFVDLTIKYGLPKPLEMDANAQSSAFANGKAAMMVGQGDWQESAIVKTNPSIQLGIMAYPISDDPNQAMLIGGVNHCFRVNKDSENLDEIKKFFNWMYTSDYGKKWFTDVAKLISPLKGASLPEGMQIPKDFQAQSSNVPVGVIPETYSLDSFWQKFGEIMQAYIGDTKNREQYVSQIEDAWIKLGDAK